MDDFPAFRAAAVQAAPVFLDRDRTIEKAVDLIYEASSNGAKLIVFPEVFVAGYPYWAWTMNPVEGGKWFERFYKEAAVEIPGPHIDAIRVAAARTSTIVVIGVNEKSAINFGTIYNSMVTIGSDGSVLGVHRKLVPTWAEKLVYGNGDGASLRVHNTEIGRLGALACGENTNTLARFTLLAQGEMVHVASYVASPVVPADYDMADAISMRTAAHCFEGKVFSVVSCSTISEEIIDMVAGDNEEVRHNFRREHSALSGIFGPDGRPIVEPLVDDEGIVYGDIDLNKCIAAKQMHDITGHYNRFDIFSLSVNGTAHEPVSITDGPAKSSSVLGPIDFDGIGEVANDSMRSHINPESARQQIG